MNSKSLNKFIKKLFPSRLKEIGRELLGVNFVHNPYKTAYKKNVLVSYLTSPFLHGVDFSHSNFQEVISIGKVFNQLGYNVDVIDHRSKRRYDPGKYDVIFGLGEPLEFALRGRSRLKKNPLIVWHATGSHPFFSNTETIKRLQFSYAESGSLLMKSTRFIDKLCPLTYCFSDLIVLIGNEVTKATFLNYTKAPIELINPTTYISHWPRAKTLENKNNYVWFGSAGAIHKGLDLLLNVFRSNSEINLHVCGPVEMERDFCLFYKEHLNNSPNIFFYGFVDVKSKIFIDLMDKATFCILPSCSEGMATSVLTTVANGGLIPIVSRNSGIDIDGDDIIIDDISLEAIQRAIVHSQNLTIEQIQERSNVLLRKAREWYTVSRFEETLLEIMTKYGLGEEFSN